MYQPYEGGSEYTLCKGQEDLEITVYLPPVGYVPVGDDLEPREILSRSSIPEEQYWDRNAFLNLPENYEAKKKKEKRLQEQDPDYFDEELETYRAREWGRRLNGVWFMNNGKPHYLTGTNYFFLAHWRLPHGFPKFRIPNMEWFYFMKWVEESPVDRGGNELTKRRDGKTARAGCWVFDRISKKRSFYGGIQSKTDTDGKKNVFQKFVITPFKKLDDFWKPAIDPAKGTSPTSELVFSTGSKKGSKAITESYEDGDELESWIAVRSAGTFAWDGEMLHAYVCDEVGKPVMKGEVDVYDRHDVVMPCLEDSEGNIIGKALYTTTFDDESDKDSVKAKQSRRGFKKLWEDSDHSKRNETGSTNSMLVRYFLPAHRAKSYDKYGYPDEEKNLQYFLLQRKVREHDPKALASYIRKYPLNWKEALRGMNDDCLYNEAKIDSRLDFVQWKKGLTEKGNLRWKDGIRFGEVEWVKSHSGRWEIGCSLEELDKAGILNNVKKVGHSFYPQNALKVTLGIDPFSHNKTVFGGSQGACAVHMDYDATLPDISDNFICIYLGRPPKLSMFSEDMIMTAWFFGGKALIESNREGCIQYFEDEGARPFLMEINGKVGIATSMKTHQQIVEETEEFIEDRCQAVKFERLLLDWKHFDMHDTERFDLGMASGIALIGANDSKRRKKRAPTGSINAKRLFRKHKMVAYHG